MVKGSSENIMSYPWQDTGLQNFPEPERNIFYPPPPPPLQKQNLLDGMSPEERKKYPVADGVFDYFPNALYRIARVSYEGNKQHNPGERLHWSRGKSDDHRNCEARHMLADSEEEHKAAKAWRALADLELFLEQKYNIKPPPGVR